MLSQECTYNPITYMHSGYSSYLYELSRTPFGQRGLYVAVLISLGDTVVSHSNRVSEHLRLVKYKYKAFNSRRCLS